MVVTLQTFENYLQGYKLSIFFCNKIGDKGGILPRIFKM